MGDTTCPECGALDDGGGHVCAPREAAEATDWGAEIAEMKDTQRWWSERVISLLHIIERQAEFIGHIMNHLHMKLPPELEAADVPAGDAEDEVGEDGGEDGEDGEDGGEDDKEENQPSKRQKMDQSNVPMQFARDVLLPSCHGNRPMFLSTTDFRRKYNKWAAARNYESLDTVNVINQLVTNIPNFRLKTQSVTGVMFSRDDIRTVTTGRKIIITSAGSPIASNKSMGLPACQSIAMGNSACQSITMFVKKEWIDSKVSLTKIRLKTIHAGYIQWCIRNHIEPQKHASWFSRRLIELFPTAYTVTLGRNGDRFMSFDHERGMIDYAGLNQ